ncbi:MULTISPECIES: LysR substrate-binding domain-containing protein [unclassified Sphingopyxis]|uniref:LysR substrate-binding domain-containing protein n=1 Tax=unclassified Sphingopyxis TaxID=2614943 RepID=UPI000736C435|nr:MULTISPECIES: LysR substrate-binding domain-containing protein [unclassified Sphingopyxis]KTE28934.1 LysR family transcriptional regulator [Sphingopyxis sp. HIX]KTE81410.1 LysR family transcriptional regulator [Sphingopyxis sp. HXXIV]
MVSRDKLPPLASIRAFEAAARLESFARAAQELGTTAASVSYHVRQLEQQTGLRLFVRHPHRVELTMAGVAVASEATAAFAALRASFVKARDRDEARLSLTALPTLGTSWLTPRLGLFRARHPDIAIELELSAEPQPLGDGRFDAAIRHGLGDWRGLRSVRLFPVLFTPLCAPGLKGAVGDLEDPSRPLGVPLLGRPDWWASWYRALGVAAGPPPGRFGTSLAAEHLDIAAAVAGHGIAIGSPILFRDEIAAGRLVPAHDLVAGDGRAFWFVYPVVRLQSPKIARFRDWLCDEAAAATAPMRNLIDHAVILEP